MPMKKINLALDFRQELSCYLLQHNPQFPPFQILSQSLDARFANRGRAPKIHYQVLLSADSFTSPLDPLARPPEILSAAKKLRPVIVGMGPGGLFAALRLLDFGIKSILIERGAPAAERMKDISQYWRYGKLNPESNVCFGEGGAGLFSDGKLISRIKSPFISYVMKRLVAFGAPPETAYLANPHLGSNKIRRLISKISAYLQAQGCQLRYQSKVVDLAISGQQIAGVVLASGEVVASEQVILATGHSARDIYQLLARHQVAMKAKDFAIGMRIEHPRDLINRLQYGPFSTNARLETARYRLSYHDPSTQRGHYSFCMCPGGYVLAASTEADGMVTNGMSNFQRNAPWSNAGLVVTVAAGRDFAITGTDTDTDTDVADPLAGMHFQRHIEHQAYLYSLADADGKKLPAVRVDDFCAGKVSSQLPATSVPSGIFPAQMAAIFSPMIITQLQKALGQFNQQLPGFVGPEGILVAPETRTSAPATILRDKISRQSLTLAGLYPCGEGAGQAGGITSAAVDGIECANAIIRLLGGVDDMPLITAMSNEGPLDE